ncbi:MAG: GMC family oxidoreductase [Myxococcales bacterium]|nr:GMC family oxidoreductase [Myxococcales bacterium]
MRSLFGGLARAPAARIDSDASIVHGRELSRGFRHRADVVVVGSGASGMTLAAILAEAGLEVLVLEEGPYYRHQDIAQFTPTQSLRRLFREAGMLTAIGVGQTPLISLTVGRAVGGSSLLTGGVCYRIPSRVHHEWVREHGLTELSEARLEAAYVEVERRIAVTEVPVDMRSLSTAKFVEGAEKLGISMKPLRRNTGHECEGNGRCNFGCPIGAKRSVDIAYLPSLLAHRGRVVSDAMVDGVIERGGRVIGVRGQLLGGAFGAPSHRFEVEASAVIVACGTVHTPGVLRAAGIRSYGLGRFLTLHPCARVVGRFDDALHGWDGALQSCFADSLDDDGTLFNSVYTPVNMLAASFPGVGPELHARVRELTHYGVFGTMVHDEAGGRLVPGIGREPTLLYEMAPRDLARLKKGMGVLAEMAFAAGAREVLLPIFGMTPLRTMDDTRRFAAEPLDARRLECLSFHPLGSARMANDRRRGVVDDSGECFEAPGLFVVDGSVLPTSIGVNSQVPIMAMATRLAWRLRDRLV